MKGVIGLHGTGSDGVWDAVAVGIIGSDGSFALSSSTRVSFYQSPIENPRMCAIYDCTKRSVGTLVLYTYFALNPHWLAAANRRIPLSWADLDAIAAYITTSNDSRLPLIVSAGNSNFGIQHRLFPISGDVWAFEKKIEIRGPLVADEEMAAEYAALYAPYSAAVGGAAICYRDLSDSASKPWSGTFKEA
jgi:hypothetical protein